ncbi:hypothetical protein L1277_001815 [Okibacterium sp. HSC-33S16]|nr:hypothetical protein [Okibacterium sp. HSC-33S16]
MYTLEINTAASDNPSVTVTVRNWSDLRQDRAARAGQVRQLARRAPEIPALAPEPLGLDAFDSRLNTMTYF